MKLFSQAKVDIVVASGVLSVTIRPNPGWFWMLLEIVFIVFFSGLAVRSWHGFNLMTRVIFVWVEIAGAQWLYQLTGSERIEIDARQLIIQKQVLGWPRVREYRIEECSELELDQQHEDDHYALQCKIGWRTVRFGQYLSEDKATEVLATLQKELPDVAQKLITTSSGKNHFVTLGLSSR